MGTYGGLGVVAPVLDALGDPTRRVILETLRRDGPSSVGRLAERVPVSRPAISQHLKVLGLAGLVDHESKGTRNIYRVDRTGLDPLRGWLDQFWGDALDAFAEHVRRTEASESRGPRVRRTGDEPEGPGVRRTEDEPEGPRVRRTGGESGRVRRTGGEGLG
ncbi:ArsR/SmtB family transcription factor [Kribbella caucasensis]|uniref:ArsR/SmtB family transcription factor n=1 Tax=Kribbella caucasensis TaxID=2512215 RepID=UPI001EE0DBF2|nr:metalloregulator ArsR/SmtB family transcription factor [Kribbella sp. VKM Ac-2527]